jgi:hypothetical protein
MPITGPGFQELEQLAAIRSGQPRKATKQFWAAGCSVTVGVGVDTHQTWKEIVSRTIQLPYSDLSAEGSSVIWQSDQICQSEIMQGDLVLWALTVPPRLPVIKQLSLFHLTPGEYAYDKSIDKQFPIDLLLHPTLMYHNIQAIRRANNFCTRIGAKLIVMSVLYDAENAAKLYGIPNYHQMCQSPQQWLDLGSDKLHPGPQQHQAMADKFIELIK